MVCAGPFIDIQAWMTLASYLSSRHFSVKMKKTITVLGLTLSVTLVASLSLCVAATAADVVGDPKAADVSMCIGCHGIPGYKASFPEVFQVPMLGGQSAKYIESALKAYRKGDRKHPTMRGIAGGLSDQDIANLAAYYSQQK
jgi:cytochrome c553